MGLEKLELLAQKLIQLEDDYDAYEFSDTYDDYLPNLDNDKYDGIVGDTMSAIVNNSYEILNELEDMYYDVEDVDEEMANDILSLMDEVEVYSSYTPAERVSENKLLEEYLSKKEIIMENKFESIIRGRELKEDNVHNEVEERNEFVKNIPFDELFDKIRSILNFPNLELNVEFKGGGYSTGRYAYDDRDKLHPEITSSNLVKDLPAWLQPLFNTFIVKSNNSIVDRDKNGYYWHSRFYFYYESTNSSNGTDYFLGAMYKNGKWEFREEIFGSLG